MGNYAILFQHIWHNVHNSEMTTYVRILLIVSGDASDMDQHTHSTDLLYHTFQIRFCSPYYVYVNLKVPFIPLHHYFMCIYSVKMMDTDGNAVPII